MAVRVELRRDAGKISAAHGPWIRRRQVARVKGPPDPAAVAELVDHRGRRLGFGLYSPESALVLRMLSFGERAPDEAWLERRLGAALASRAALGLGAAGSDSDGYREVNSEGDGLPGLVVDRFGDWRVLQITTAPMHARREAILAWLEQHAALDGGQILLAPEGAGRREGFPAELRVCPREAGARGPEQLRWREHGRHFTAPAPPAQKTGAYHDQRVNRARFAELAAGLPGGHRILDLGAHVGGFCLALAARDRQVLAVDQSAEVLEHLRANAAANGCADAVSTLAADMFGELDDPALAGPFDAVIFDPPKIASSRRDLGRARGAMVRTLARLLPRLAEPGLIGVCSCSHHLDGVELDKAMLEASARANRPCTRVAAWGPGPDHPVWPGHAEGEYLRVQVYATR